MTISELIAHLESIKAEYGNINVNTEDGEIDSVIVDYLNPDDEETFTKTVILL